MIPCTNCGAELSGNYCEACGQKRFVESDRRFAHLVHQLVASATDLDGRVWRSLIALVFKPGLLSREYIDGRRARWISPISLFLAINVIYFLAPLHGSDLALQFNQQVSAQIRALANPQTPLTAAQQASTGQAHTRYTMPLIDARVEQRNAAALAASGGKTGYTMADYRVAYDAKADDVSKGLIILHVPFTALVLMAIFVDRRRYFAEHFVVALHFFAFLLIGVQLLVHVYALLDLVLPTRWTPPDGTLDWIARVVFALYATVALHRAYTVGWVRATVSAMALLAASVVVNLYIYRAIQFLVTFALT